MVLLARPTAEHQFGGGAFALERSFLLSLECWRGGGGESGVFSGGGAAEKVEGVWAG